MKPHDDPSLRIDTSNPLRPTLRIAFVTETYPPEVNGVATTVAQFVRGLHDSGHDVELVRPGQASEGRTIDPSTMALAPVREFVTRGLPIPRYPQLRMGLPSRSALIRRWAERRPDVVHIATEGPLGWSALRAARHLGLPVTTDFRTNFHAYSQHYGVGWLYRPIMAYLRSFHNRAQATFVPTVALRNDLSAAGFERVAVVARGVDADRFTPGRRSEELRRSWGAGAKDLVIGYVGRLAAEKNLQGLADAAWAIRVNRPTVRFVIVGDGPQRAALEQAMPDAVFTGTRQGLDLAAHYASLDLFLFPSLTETFGNVTVEALASGVPVVAFDYAAAAQVVEHGCSGWLARLGDAVDFIACAQAAAEQALSSPAASVAARHAALRHGWNRVMAQFEANLADVCQASKAIVSATAAPNTEATAAAETPPAVSAA